MEIREILTGKVRMYSPFWYHPSVGVTSRMQSRPGGHELAGRGRYQRAALFSAAGQERRPGLAVDDQLGEPREANEQMNKNHPKFERLGLDCIEADLCK